jgi:hypothetical protein
MLWRCIVGFEIADGYSAARPVVCVELGKREVGSLLSADGNRRSRALRSMDRQLERHR